MIKVYVKKQSSYPVSSVKIRKQLANFLKERGIVSDSQVSVAIVGKAKIRELAKRYLNDDREHSVLSFPASEVKGEFVYPPNGLINLGEIVICYSLVQAEAENEGKLVEDKITELILHSALHLLGIHHEE